MRIPKHACPHCKSAMILRSSRQEHALLKTVYAQCTNPFCGATFKGRTEWLQQLSPSATPNPEILKQLKQPA
ncbi:ogr/Delta-like zinc finger family protein [Acinetobacter populi]|uniref:Zinc finger Ogr/Delta-type domain-containing protein n=1 Tax=Acinetobacter populi TaxID=1582270 RepID=A0A1Z9Z2Q3_9GAMM|nr:ogr/Delta-like zinc finger family protein [Acinetobacter populi]OUY08719.1 hypothetical protein CAP51_03650 [Acinetobacter populi]